MRARSRRRATTTIALATSFGVALAYWLYMRPTSVPIPDEATRGAIWSEVRRERAPADPGLVREPELGQWMAGVVAGGPGYVAYGYDEDRLPQGIGAAFAIWISSDAREWREVEFEPQTLRHRASISDMAAGPSGIVAVGDICCLVDARGVGAARPVRWFSPDGESWEKVEGPPPPPDASADVSSAVAAGPGGFVQVGQFQHRPTAWSSADGRRWIEHSLHEPGFDGGLVADVAVDSQGYVAVGHLTRGGASIGAAWRSTEGLLWRRVGREHPILVGPQAVELSRAVPFEHGLFVIGRRELPPDEVRCEVGGMFQRRMCVESESIHLRSADLERWEELPSPEEALRPGELIEYRALAAGGPGLVVVGAGFQADQGVWTSADGAMWHRTAPRRQLRPAERAYGILVEGETVVAVGEVDGDGAVWIITCSDR